MGTEARGGDQGKDNGKVPRARLNQIATRKLGALAVTTRVRPDGETVEGELTFKSVNLTHPVKGGAIARASFIVMGHDRLLFMEPPLAALGPLAFYDVETLPAFEQRVAAALSARMTHLNRLADKMRSLQMDVGLEPDRLVVRGVKRSAGFVFELLGGPEGVRVWRVTPAGGKTWEAPRNLPVLSLESYARPEDLEIHLTSSVSRWEQQRQEEKPAAPESSAAPSAPGAAPRTGLIAVPAKEDALTVGLLRRFGDGAVVTPGAKLEVSQDFEYDGTKYRFHAVHERGSTFKGKLVGPSGDAWNEKFDLARFPGISTLLSTHFKIPLPTPPQRPPETGAPAPVMPPPTSAASGSSPTLTGVIAPPPPSTSSASAPGTIALGASPLASIPDYLQPHAGEVWVMMVLIEQERDGEVRYVCTDPDGRPYGAPRILKRADFESVFYQEKGGWRLCIHIDGVQGESVVYRQLDTQRQPRGSAKSLATSILVSTFTPESAVY